MPGIPCSCAEGGGSLSVILLTPTGANGFRTAGSFNGSAMDALETDVKRVASELGGGHVTITDLSGHEVFGLE